jgi:hypothetical protein
MSPQTASPPHIKGVATSQCDGMVSSTRSILIPTQNEEEPEKFISQIGRRTFFLFFLRSNAGAIAEQE